MTHACQRTILVGGIAILMVASPAWAQLQIGDNASMNLNGDVSFGYSGAYSNYTGSSHTISPSGNADLSGYYYNPSFLSFDVRPFYNESRANSSYQSMFRAGGVSADASVFSGSHFPGTVSYSKMYNSQGSFAVPGTADLTTRGNSSTLGLGWGIQIPDYPRVAFQFVDSNNDSSIYGTDSDATFKNKLFSVNASDEVAGFNLNGGYHHTSVHALTPEFLANEGPTISDTTSNGFDGSATHKLPMRGSFSVGGGWSGINSVANGQKYSGTIDMANAGLGFQPVENLNLGVTGQYTNNLEGSIYQPFVTAGGVAPAPFLNYSTHSLDINSQATYSMPAQHLTLLGGFERRNQSGLYGSITSDSLNEIVSYGNVVRRGFLTITVGATQNIIGEINAPNSRGFFANTSYTRKYERWRVNGGFNYSHNTQTAFIGYTSSGYGYSAGLGRKIGTYYYWSANASVTKSRYSQGSGADTTSQNYSTSLSLKRFSVSGSFGKSDGTSILTPTGLTPITSPTPVTTPFPQIVFNAKAYSFGASTNPIHGLVLSANYSKSRSDTLADMASSLNKNASLNALLQYRLRQVWITGGYLRLQQGFSITGLPASSDSSFFIGITRWFTFF